MANSVALRSRGTFYLFRIALGKGVKKQKKPAYVFLDYLNSDVVQIKKPHNEGHCGALFGQHCSLNHVNPIIECPSYNSPIDLIRGQI